MSLIDKNFVFNYFPMWEKFFVNAEGDPDQEILDNEITGAEEEFGEYLTRTEDDVTLKEQFCILTLLRKRGFDRLHGDTAFETKPQIIKDYEATIEKLRNSRASITVTANDKKFTGGNWFNEPAEEGE